MAVPVACAFYVWRRHSASGTILFARDAVIESMKDGLIVLDRQNRIVDLNPAAEQILHCSRSEAIGQLVRQILPDWSASVEPYSEMMETRDEIILTEDGRQRYFDLCSSPLHDQRNHLIGRLVVLHDITERKQAEEALRESEERFRVTFEQAAVGVAHVAPDGRWIRVNQTLCDILGYTRSELLGRTFQDITYPDDLDIGPRLVDRMLAGELQTASLEKRYVRKDGSYVWVKVTSSLVQEPSGQPKYFISVIEDITERRRAGQALRQRTVELQASNEELDAFAHTVAHGLKNPLAVVITNAETLEQDYGTVPEDKRQQFLQNIVSAGFKMTRIIEELLLLAGVRKAKVKLEPLDMASIVAESLQRLAHMIEAHQPEIILPESWPVAMGYGPWVEEVWVNYLSNAIKYSGPPPRVELGATRQENGKVCFWVRDNGPGLTPEEQGRLFTPFTRLSQVRTTGGYGLGLSIVRRIVERLGGEVGVESEVGQGSVFTFTLQGGAHNERIKRPKS